MPTPISLRHQRVVPRGEPTDSTITAFLAGILTASVLWMWLL